MSINIKLENIENFHYELCCLDFYRDFSEDVNLHNVFLENDKILGEDENLKHSKSPILVQGKTFPPVPTDFDSIEDYIKIWSPLFLMESKA